MGELFVSCSLPFCDYFCAVFVFGTLFFLASALAAVWALFNYPHVPKYMYTHFPYAFTIRARRANIVSAVLIEAAVGSCSSRLAPGFVSLLTLDRPVGRLET